MNKRFELIHSNKQILEYCSRNNLTVKAFYLVAFILLQKLTYEKKNILYKLTKKESIDELSCTPIQLSSSLFIKEFTKEVVNEIRKISHDDFTSCIDTARLETNNENVLIQWCKAKDIASYPSHDAINLQVIFMENSSKIDIIYYFDEMEYSENEILIMQMHFETLIQSLLNLNAISIDELKVISPYEKQILEDVNATETQYSKGKCVHEILQKVAKNNKEQIALLYNDIEISYETLNRKTNQLARVLINTGVQKGDCVALIAKRGIELIYAIFAIMKAGAIYVPVAVNCPDERKKHILDECNIKNILTTEDRCTWGEGRYILNLNQMDLTKEDDSNLECVNCSKDVATIIYTSGTTHLPKGVLIRHNTIVNYCEYNLREFNINHEDSIIQFAPFTFSTAIYEIATTLFAGARLCLVTDSTIADIGKFQQYMEKVKVTILLLPSQYCDFIIPTKNLRIIETGASPCSANTSEKMRKFTRHINAYGLTEGSIVAVWKGTDKTTPKKIPIGKPVANTKAYVMRHNALCGMYMPGELCVTGMAVSEGYLNNPVLNEKVFVNNPFGEGKMLKTGDIVQWNYNGELEYIGRKDNQVKIRGMRVELEEVENTLKIHSKTNKVAVICKEDKEGDNSLIAFISSDKKVDVGQLKEVLAKHMLYYMIPNFIYQIDEMPLTVNGKIDKKALKNIHVKEDNDYVPPKNKTEEIITSIFEKVLNIKHISIKQGFFELGGHSLKAIKATNQIELETGIRISIIDFFEKQTPENIAAFINSNKQKHYTRISQISEATYYETSSAQMRVYILEKLENQRKKYNLPFAIQLTGEIDINKVEEAVQALIKRHEILRTSFHMIGNAVVQKVHEKIDFKIEYVTAYREVEKELEDFIKPFKLNELPLIRVKALKTGENQHVLLFDMHHIISDGTSMQILKTELSKLYNKEPLDPLPIQYKDYAFWQNNQMHSNGLNTQLNYWQEVFKEDLPVLNFPCDFVRPTAQSYQGNSIPFEIDSDLTKKLYHISKQTGATLYMVLLAAYNVLLAKYTGQEDIIVGSPIAGRNHPDTENLLGMFINTLPIRNYPKSEQSFNAFLQEVKFTCMNAYKNSDCPFEKIVEAVNVVRDSSRNPLFDTMLIVQNMSDEKLVLGEAVAHAYKIESKVSLVDMTMCLEEINGKIQGNMEYCSKLFCKQRIERFIKNYIEVLKSITLNLEQPIGHIAFIGEEELHTLISTFNSTKVTYDSEKTIQDLFEKMVQVFPNKIALDYNNITFTYKKLNEEANKVAHFLRKKGVERNTIVGLLLKRTPHMLIGLLGILKAGGTYLPLDPEYPLERISYILQDSGTKYVLVDHNVQSSIVESYKKINLSEILNTEENIENPSVINKATDSAYIIYTSGSTGNPKGVVIGHKAVHNLIIGVGERIVLNQTKTILNLTTISFDIFVLESIVPLVKGMTIVLCDEIEQLDAKKIARKIFDNHVDIMQLTPSRMQIILESKEGKAALKCLESILLGGEALTENVLNNVKQQTDARLFNMYGPTETTVWSTINEQTNTNDITIGEPIANTEIYITNTSGQVLPIGVPGELCIGGDGLAKGYHHKETLTEEKFIRNPYYPSGKMYKTGDLACWREDGKIVYLGRLDFQVKIRGYRIELEEIESQIDQLDEIKENIVVVQTYENGVNYLVDYYVKATQIDEDEIREKIRNILPEYMIPSYFVELEEMPYTPNGKLDRKALTARQLTLINTICTYEAPESEYEKLISKTWEEVLQRKEISLNENFFDAGGNSLLLVKVFERLSEKVSAPIQVADLFSNPTIKKMANLLETKQKEAKYNQLEIQGLRLPKEFYSTGSTLQKDYKTLVLDKEVYTRINNIANSNSVEISSMLFSIYLLMLSRITKNANVALTIKERASTHLSHVKMDVSKYEKIEALFNDLNSAVKTPSLCTQLSANSIMGYKNKEKEGGILPLVIYNGTVEAYMLECFDLILNMDNQGDKIAITYIVNLGRINKSKGEYSIELFLNMLELCIENLSSGIA